MHRLALMKTYFILKIVVQSQIQLIWPDVDITSGAYEYCKATLLGSWSQIETSLKWACTRMSMVVSAFSSISIEDIARAGGLTWSSCMLSEPWKKTEQDLFPILNFPKVSSLTVHLCELTLHQTCIKAINKRFTDVTCDNRHKCYQQSVCTGIGIVLNSLIRSYV